MRTTADAQISPIAREAKGGARRSRAGAAQPPLPPASPSIPAGAAAAEPAALAVTTVRMLRVEEGLHALRVGEMAGGAGEVMGMSVPAALVAVPLAGTAEMVETVAAFPGRGPWFGRNGGTMILRSPPGGGYVIVTVYGAPDQPASAPSLDVRRLDGPGDGAGLGADGGQPRLSESRDLGTEVLLHIERAGDRLFPGRGWVGALGRRMRIEAFSIRPLERLAPAELEMKGFLPNGGETPWIPGGVLCGTRGRGLPLTGFAVRVVPHRADRFEVVYQGSFFAGGISEPCRNGEPCRASGDDPLEAINLRVTERGTGTAETAG